MSMLQRYFFGSYFPLSVSIFLQPCGIAKRISTAIGARGLFVPKAVISNSAVAEFDVFSTLPRRKVAKDGAAIKFR